MIAETSSRQAVERLRDIQPELTRYGVGRVWLFGSRARGEAQDGSDWDILVEFTQPPTFDSYMNLKEHLEQRLGAPVDLVSRGACRPHFLAAIGGELLDVA